MEIVKAKETFPFVIQPNRKKLWGRSSFIIRLYLGFTYNSLYIQNTSVNYMLMGSSNVVINDVLNNVIYLVSLIPLLLGGNTECLRQQL